VAPVILLVLGVLLIMGSTKKPAPAPTEQPPEQTDDYLAKVRADLEK
jgi:cytochrome c-type biogenesis protein CcmH/NrfF